MLIFKDLKDSALNPGWIMLRNKQIYIRYELIQELNPNRLIFWAAAFIPFIWTAGCMQNHIFNYLIKELEPDKVQVWPLKIKEILYIFRVKKSFIQS